MNLKSTLVAAVLIANLCSPTNVFAQQDRRDGSWWITLVSPSIKNWYVVGIFDGLLLGRDFSAWAIPGKGKSTIQDQAASATDSFDYFYGRYFKNVKSDQLADGIDEFYKDYRNRSIQVERAVWIVLNGIAGTPERLKFRR